MRYPADQKTRAKDAIVAAAGKRLKRQGFDGIGVDGLAAAAGVTSGAFYSSFAKQGRPAPGDDRALSRLALRR